MNLAYNKNIDPESGVLFGNSFSAIFCVRFFKKNVTHVKFYLPLLLEILSNICIAIVCFPDYGVINFEINLIFLIKQFLYMTKKSRQKV